MYYRNPQQCLVLDVRTLEEVDECPARSDMILDIPLPPLSPHDVAELTQKLYDIAANMNTSQCIKVFCAKGKRSAVAVAILKQAGFKNVIDLGGVECG